MMRFVLPEKPGLGNKYRREQIDRKAVMTTAARPMLLSPNDKEKEYENDFGSETGTNLYVCDSGSRA
jgi:hypothetical protein